MVTRKYVEEMNLQVGDRIKVECHDDLKDDLGIGYAVGTICFSGIGEPDKKNPIGKLLYHKDGFNEFVKARGLHWVQKLEVAVQSQ